MLKFDHVGIRVLDMEKSKKFYTDILQCEIIKDYQSDKMHVIFLDAGGVVLELIYKEANEKRNYGPVEHLAFKVEDLNEKIEFLKKQGIELNGGPKIVDDSRLVFFDGPNSERIEFVEKLK